MKGIVHRWHPDRELQGDGMECKPRLEEDGSITWFNVDFEAQQLVEEPSPPERWAKETLRGCWMVRATFFLEDGSHPCPEASDTPFGIERSVEFQCCDRWGRPRAPDELKRKTIYWLKTWAPNRLRETWANLDRDRSREKLHSERLGKSMERLPDIVDCGPDASVPPEFEG